MRTGLLLILLSLAPSGLRADGPDEASIKGWIAQLADPRWRVREQASRKLWQAGRKGERLLRDAWRRTDSPEVRWRAAALLEMFEVGIYPGTPRAVWDLLQSYRSSPSARPAIISKLFNVGPKAYPTLLRLARAERDPQERRKRFWPARTLSEKRLASLIASGERAEAETLLELGAICGFGLSQRNYAAYHLLTGQLSERTEALRGRYRRHPDSVLAELLVHCYRGQGKLREALKIAERAKDPDLLEGVLHELGQWGRLAELLARRAGIEKDIEGLGYLSAYQRLSGDTTGYRKTLARIKALARGDQVWFSAEALLLNREIQQAIDLLLAHKQYRQAFALLAGQQRYQEAFALVERLRKTWPVQQRFNFELVVAETLAKLGRRAACRELLRSLLTAERTRPEPRLAPIVEAAARAGLTDEAERICRELIDTLEAAPARRLAMALLRDRRKEAGVLWDASQQRRHGRRLAEVRAILGSKSPDTALEAIRGRLTKSSDDQRSGLATVARKAGRLAFAEGMLLALATAAKRDSRWVELGRLQLQRKAWQRAAASFEKAFQLNPLNDVALYLMGWALHEKGEVKRGAGLMKVSRQLPLASGHRRYELAREASRLGRDAEAARSRRLSLTLGAFNSWYVNNARWYAARRAAAERRYDVAAELYERYTHQCFKRQTAFSRVGSYLTTTATVHKWRAMALVEAGKVEAGMRQARRVLEISPADTDMLIRLLPLLVARGRKPLADRLFAERYRRLQGLVAAYPDSAHLHNQIAWLAAACGRRLDAALAHARRAVKLAPDHPSYLDTLAEAHYRKGDKVEARKLNARCLELEPGDAHYLKQKKRFSR